MISKILRVLKITLYKMRYGNKITFASVPNFIRKRAQFNILSGKIFVGKSVSVKNSAYFAVVNGGVLKIGDSVSFNTNCNVICHEKITIGQHCSFGPNVSIYDHDHNFGENGLESGFHVSPVVIGDNCWIGANVTILRGTNIGDGCVIGAGTVVKGDIPAHSLVTSDRHMRITPIKDRKLRRGDISETKGDNDET